MYLPLQDPFDGGSSLCYQETMNTSLGTRIFIETARMPLEPRSLARSESRLGILQQELTTESLDTAWSNDNKVEQELRQKHKLVSKDAQSNLAPPLTRCRRGSKRS